MQHLGRNIRTYAVWRRIPEDQGHGDIADSWQKDQATIRVAVYPASMTAMQLGSGIAPTASCMGYPHAHGLKVGDCLGSDEERRYRITGVAHGYIDTILTLEDMDWGDVA